MMTIIITPIQKQDFTYSSLISELLPPFWQCGMEWNSMLYNTIQRIWCRMMDNVTDRHLTGSNTLYGLTIPFCTYIKEEAIRSQYCLQAEYCQGDDITNVAFFRVTVEKRTPQISRDSTNFLGRRQLKSRSIVLSDVEYDSALHDDF